MHETRTAREMKAARPLRHPKVEAAFLAGARRGFGIARPCFRRWPQISSNQVALLRFQRARRFVIEGRLVGLVESRLLIHKPVIRCDQHGGTVEGIDNEPQQLRKLLHGLRCGLERFRF